MDEKLEVRMHYIECHRKRYYNGVGKNRIDDWFAFFGSRSFEEMDKILKKLVYDRTRIECIRKEKEKVEKDKSIYIIKRMLEEKISYEIISKVTDLSYDEIKKVENELIKGNLDFFVKIIT